MTHHYWRLMDYRIIDGNKKWAQTEWCWPEKILRFWIFPYLAVNQHLQIMRSHLVTRCLYWPRIGGMKITESQRENRKGNLLSLHFKTWSWVWDSSLSSNASSVRLEDLSLMMSLMLVSDWWNYRCHLSALFPHNTGSNKLLHAGFWLSKHCGILCFKISDFLCKF